MPLPSAPRILPPLAFGVRQKMVLVLLCVLSVALGTTTWLSWKQQRQQVLRATTEHGQDLSRIVSQALSYSVISYDYHTIQLLLDEITKARDVGYAKVISQRGNVMAESGRAPSQSTEWSMFESDIAFDGAIVGRLQIGLDMGRIIESLERERSATLSREIVIILLIAIGEFVALSYLIIRPVTVIYRSLTQGLDENGRIVQPIPLISKDELGMLSRQFNNMGEQLNQANARLQERIVSADHRLTETNRQLVQQAEELKRMNAELERIAITDPLTGLYNRRYFEDALETDVALAARHGDINSLLLIDVDHFKSVNDTFGHPSGDVVLRDIAQIIAAALRKSDVACRFGGEEFLALCRRADKLQSMAIAEKIRTTIAAHGFRSLDHESIDVTVSIGVLTFPDRPYAEPSSTYVQRADMALYASKAAGRNCVTHFSDLASEANT